MGKWGTETVNRRLQKSQSYKFVTKTGLNEKTVQTLFIRQDCRQVEKINAQTKHIISLHKK